ncbi:MAG TPA: DUF1559 domain-containing protein, partial [Gemmataceae bacterium]|nr:DUF1559 domain-containing protein [Gemmataceae bacterium]
IQNSRVTLYKCPTDPTIGNEKGFASYSQNGQVFGHNYENWGSKARFYPANLPDGTSNTIFFTDKLAFCDKDTSIWDYPQNYWPDWGPIIASSELNRGGLVLNSAPQFSPKKSTIDSRAMDCYGARASTFHTGGMVVGMGDGSVRTVGPGINVQIWWNALTPDGGETQTLP